MEFTYLYKTRRGRLRAFHDAGKIARHPIGCASGKDGIHQRRGRSGKEGEHCGARRLLVFRRFGVGVGKYRGQRAEVNAQFQRHPALGRIRAHFLLYRVHPKTLFDMTRFVRQNRYPALEFRLTPFAGGGCNRIKLRKLSVNPPVTAFDDRTCVPRSSSRFASARPRRPASRITRRRVKCELLRRAVIGLGSQTFNHGFPANLLNVLAPVFA